MQNKPAISVKEIAWEIVAKYELAAKNEGLSFAKNSVYHGFYYNDILFGIGALLYRGKDCTFKSHFVFPPFRKRGLYGKAFLLQKEIAFSKGVRYLYGNCTKMSVGTHIRLGAKVVEEFRNGVTRLRYENIQ